MPFEIHVPFATHPAISCVCVYVCVCVRERERERERESLRVYMPTPTPYTHEFALKLYSNGSRVYGLGLRL
jgi:hypothetical protein